MITWLHNTYKPQLFYPFVPFVSVQALKIGHFTITERWQQVLKNIPNKDIHIAANCLPNNTIIDYALQHKDLPSNVAKHFIILQSIVDLLKHNTAIFNTDLILLLKRKKAKLHSTVPNMWLENDVQLQSSFFNTTNGAIYISKNVEIQEGVCLRGPLYIGENTVIKMGATIYGTTFIGSNCIVGGEVKNSIIMDNSNKAHYGYLGDSIVGEWCNLGAGTSNSNIKNNASNVTITLPDFKINAGNKMGCIMGNYSKTAIHTAINTGTVIGMCSNVISSGLTPKTIPNFSWGVNGEKYIFDKAIIEIEKWMGFKNQKIKLDTIKRLKKIFDEKN
jgi:UDP-N-acetylglucosamine diphosphorylase/glucosamine-1-phosphate N-acetyltransferase